MGHIQKVEFGSYGYFGPQDKYVLDLENLRMTKESRESMGTEEVTFKEKKIPPRGLTTILSILEKLGIDNLEDYYNCPDVMDGEQWSFRAYYDDGRVVESGGSNDYPEHFEEFRDIFKPLERWCIF